MTHNDEKDRYRNNGLIANYNYKISEKLNMESNYRISETYLQYDAVCVSNAFGCSPNRDHSEEVDAVESSANISMLHNTMKV